MADDLVKKAEEALAKTKKWADEGWKMEFGDRRVNVPNLKAAMEMPETFVYKLEAIAHWERIQLQAADAAVWGEKAVEALKKGDLKTADDAAYQGVWIERGFNEKAPTWGGVYKEIHSKAG